MKPSSVTAFCPGHISGYFKRVEGMTKATTGSVGTGIVISEGVTVTVVPSDALSIRIMRKDRDGNVISAESGSPPISSVLNQLGVTASVMTECRLPIGAGFGLSAAALLATLTAVNRLFGLGLSVHDIALYSHEAEVIHRTGLGDVAACQGGGRVVRRGPGIDAEIVRKFDLPDLICAVSFGPIHTPSVLGSPEQMARVASAFPEREPDDAGDFFRLSRQFARRSGLMTPEVEEVLRVFDDRNMPAGMTMLGNGVFAYGRGSRELLEPFGEVYEFRMGCCGARIVGEAL